MKVATRAQIHKRTLRHHMKRYRRNLRKRVARLLPALDPGRPGNISLRKLVQDLLYVDKSGVWTQSSIRTLLLRIDWIVEEIIVGLRNYPHLLVTYSPLLAELLGEAGRYAERRVQGKEDAARAFFGWSERFKAYDKNHKDYQLKLSKMARS